MDSDQIEEVDAQSAHSLLQMNQPARVLRATTRTRNLRIPLEQVLGEGEDPIFTQQWAEIRRGKDMRI